MTINCTFKLLDAKQYVTIQALQRIVPKRVDTRKKKNERNINVGRPKKKHPKVV